MVMHINKVTSTNSLTMGAPTLIYVNDEGKVQKHEYERIDLSRAQNFDVVLDLSPATLTDGCMGLISFTCDNAQSHLTITFCDVYLDNGNNYAAKLSGAYVADDSNVLEYTEDEACTSLDLTGVTGLPAELPWLEGTNRVVYVGEESTLTADNVVKGAVCPILKLSATGGDFRPATAFTAQKASFGVHVDGARMLMLPFAANVPKGVTAYTIGDDQMLQEVTTIAAHQPVFIAANGDVTFTVGEEAVMHQVSFATSPLEATFRGTYVQIPLCAGDYVLGQKDGQWGWVRQTAVSTLVPFDVYAQLGSTEDFIPLDLSSTGIEDLVDASRSDVEQYYDLQGRQIKNMTNVQKGQFIIIRKGEKVKKVLVKD
jgi:hypothetical protein